MDETVVASPGPQPAPQPSKFPTWAIVLVVVIVLCCCCFGVIGLLLAFGEDILYELGLYALLPALSLLP